MDEEILVRFITIGVSIFIILAVFSTIMIYYSSAKDLGSKSEMTIEKFYSEDIEYAITSANKNGYLTATQIKNMINYYYGSTDVIINIKNVALLTGVKNSKIEEAYNVNASPSSENGFNEANYKSIMFNINPSKQYTVIKTESTDGTTIYDLAIR